jgi:ParB-like chromosome segregation protein Spo0J
MDDEVHRAEESVRIPNGVDLNFRLGPVVEVRVDDLRLTDTPRIEAINWDHVKSLVEAVSFGPVIVAKKTMSIVDGAHRVKAAKIKGMKKISARFFDGDQRDAFLLAVKLNITHGLPLTLDDRRAAASRILNSHPEMSDRSIGYAAGLSAKTIAAIRRCSSEDVHQLNARIGRDGRIRPLDTTEGRKNAVDYIRLKPESSLREIARNTGISVGTARDVRNRVREGRNPLPARACAVEEASGSDASAASSNHPISEQMIVTQSPLDALRQDPSLRYSDSGRLLIRWLQVRAVEPGEWRAAIREVPPHCRSLLAAVARQCVAAWSEFADEVEASRTSHSAP